MIAYHLSGNQRKELYERATEIQIALPYPHSDQPDLLAWARSVLPDIESGDVRAAESAELLVAPLPPTTPRATLTELLGRIVDDDQSGQRWALPLPVVVVTIADAKPRHRKGVIQWPAGVSINGRRIA